jgi:hypothetical protein
MLKNFNMSAAGTVAVAAILFIAGMGFLLFLGIATG